MYRRVVDACVLGGIMLAIFPPAVLGQGPLQNELGGGLSFAGFDYREFDTPGNQLLREEGVLAGLAGRWDGAFRQWSYGFDGEITGGTVDYDGRTQSGIPLQTRTDELIVEGRARIGWRIPLQSNFSTELFGGFGYRWWERDIQPTGVSSGVFETYRWLYASVGIDGGYRFTPKSIWRGRLEVLEPLNPEVEASLPGFDDVTLDLGAETGWRLAVINRRMIDANKHLEFTLEYTAWNLGMSNTKPLARNGVLTSFRVSEPASETRIIALRVNFMYALNPALRN